MNTDMKRVGTVWKKPPPGVSKPPLGKRIPWWHGNDHFQVAIRFFWNWYAIYDDPYCLLNSWTIKESIEDYPQYKDTIYDDGSGTIEIQCIRGRGPRINIKNLPVPSGDSPH